MQTLLKDAKQFSQADESLCHDYLYSLSYLRLDIYVNKLFAFLTFVFFTINVKFGVDGNQRENGVSSHKLFP